MASKAQQTAFNKAVEKYIISKGSVKVDRFSKDYKGFSYQIWTKGGLMDIICHEPEKSGIFSVFVRFGDMEKVKSSLPNLCSPINPYGISDDGKWNLHERTAEDAMNCLEYRIEKTVEKVIVG
jgi:hypothetical protein